MQSASSATKKKDERMTHLAAFGIPVTTAAVEGHLFKLYVVGLPIGSFKPTNSVKRETVGAQEVGYKPFPAV